MSAISRAVHWRGHAFLFDRPRPAAYSASSGRRIVLVFVLLEGVIGPRLSLFTWLHIAVPPEWIRVPVLVLLALLLVRSFAGVQWSEIGLAPWTSWSAVEKSYFIQVVVLANAIFLVIFRDRLSGIVTGPGVAQRMATVLVPTLLWGFYQELMYRGLLQTELVRRWGVVRGIVASNVVFTFGPLHFYHFARTSGTLAMFASIFVMGLFFGILFERSGNLWMVGVFHGIGNAYIGGSGNR